MSTILHVPAPDHIPDTPADLPWFTQDDGSDAIYLEFAPGSSERERAWFVDELRAFIAREVEAAHVMRDVERMAVSVS